MTVEAFEESRGALASLAPAKPAPSLLIADLSSSGDPGSEAELLSHRAHQFPIWVISSHALTVDAKLTTRGFEGILFRPVDLGELVDDIKQRVM